MFWADAAPLKYALKPTKLAPGAWMITGADEAITRQNGGAIANITILDTKDGAVIVDTGPSRRYGMELEKLARELTGKPVVRALLTHFHPDHVFGCQPFDKNALAAPKGVVDGLKQSGEDFASAMYYLAGDWMRGTEVVLPGKLIENEREDVGERRFRYLVLSGHTDSDLAVFEEKSGLLIAGDLAFLDRAPTTPHADLPTWHASISQLSELPFSKLIPGHGPAETTPRALRQTGDWLKMLDDRISEAFERGLSMNEAMTAPIPSWAEKLALARYEFERSVMHIYPKLEADRWPRVDHPDR
ncbi:MAG: quinoprotein relay system zinc metallohydrolase 1 [Alphaproteobacteria bacterium]|nr:quinoprotein relay system zinc metallohydrolase 1 [Alphaproteobacteria bacterium]